MKQAAHSWIAVRAIGLLADRGGNEGLVSLLKPYACEASVGSWLPDNTDAKSGGSATENHIFKMLPLPGQPDTRFVAQKKPLLARLGPERHMSQYLAQDTNLKDNWWHGSYKAEIRKPGQHLPNRAMAVSTMLKDLLLLGDTDIVSLLGRGRDFDNYLVTAADTQKQAASTYFFMLSHFLADSCMPCHCDGRNLADYGSGLHKEWEEHWDKAVGKPFLKDSLIKKGPNPQACVSGEQAIANARSVDAIFDLDFSKTTVPPLRPGRDVWLETVDVCRASFALSAIVAPPAQYGYSDANAKAPYAEVLAGKPTFLGDLDKVVLHDAVLNTAMIWQDIWQALTKKSAKG